MSVDERLARLNAKSQSFDSTGASFGGMSVSDLAGAMAGITPIGELIVCRKYIDPKDKGAGYYELMRDSIQLVYDKDVIPKKTNMIQPLLDLALDDFCSVFKCNQCKGRGEVILDTGQVHKCRSTRCVDGMVRRKDVDRAKALKVKAMDFRRLYKPAYDVINDYLTRTLPDAESEALILINKQANWHDYPNL